MCTRIYWVVRPEGSTAVRYRQYRGGITLLSGTDNVEGGYEVLATERDLYIYYFYPISNSSQLQI